MGWLSLEISQWDALTIQQWDDLPIDPLPSADNQFTMTGLTFTFGGGGD